MASGNQICKPICADFPITPPRNKTEIKFKKFKEIPEKYIILVFKKGINEKNTGNSEVLVSFIIKIIPKKSNKSLTLFTKTAFSAALFAFILEYQKFISKKEHSPTPSQPQKTKNKLSATIKKSIKKVNNNKYIKNRGK
jgi:hypothetical protein